MNGNVSCLSAFAALMAPPSAAVEADSAYEEHEGHEEYFLEVFLRGLRGLDPAFVGMIQPSWLNS
jgi:hypothetical protein